VGFVVEETKELPEAHRLQELKNWEKDHGYQHPDHARDVRCLLRMVEHLQGSKAKTKSLLPQALAAAAGLETRVDRVEDECENIMERVNAVVEVVTDDLQMLNRVALLLLSGEPVSLAQLTPEEREWVKFIPARVNP
jgi:hypothetical protein